MSFVSTFLFNLTQHTEFFSFFWKNTRPPSKLLRLTLFRSRGFCSTWVTVLRPHRLWIMRSFVKAETADTRINLNPRKLIKLLFRSWHGNHSRTRFRCRWLSLSLSPFLFSISFFSLSVESHNLFISPPLPLPPPHPSFLSQIFLRSCQHFGAVEEPARLDPRTTASVTWGPQRELDGVVTLSGLYSNSDAMTSWSTGEKAWAKLTTTQTPIPSEQIFKCT